MHDHVMCYHVNTSCQLAYFLSFYLMAGKRISETHQLKIVRIKYNKDINVKVFPNTFSPEHGKQQGFF